MTKPRYTVTYTETTSPYGPAYRSVQAQVSLDSIVHQGGVWTEGNTGQMALTLGQLAQGIRSKYGDPLDMPLAPALVEPAPPPKK